ncbi:MAG: hypothetical protein IJ648_03705 [Lachnospiraceae bacterium]|nr:hypothetical protein [Lachnospiraceae bacterium]
MRRNQLRNRYIAVLLSISILFGMTACGRTVPTGQENPEQPPSSADTQEPFSCNTGDTQEPDVPGETFDPGQEMTPLDYNPYYQFMLQRASEGNCIFSPESMNIAFDMYGYLLEPENQKTIKDYLGNRSYTDYSSTDVFKITSRLWINSNKEFHLPENSKLENGIAYYIDMSDPKVTDEKNQYVSEQTNGFIPSTPTEFNPDVVFDAMNILYFKDTWKDGDKWLDGEATSFTNEDGTISDVYMMHDSADSYLQSSNAHGYIMQYENGFQYMVILPDDGTELSDVDINAFIRRDVDTVINDCYLEMPEFEIESTYELGLQDFDLPVTQLSKNVYDYETEEPKITQVAKIRVDHEGTEAAAVTEIMVEDCAEISVEEPYYITCNRPFIYVIQDTENDDVAFIGVVRELKTIN